MKQLTLQEEKRRKLLDSYRKKQPFRVAIGTSTWNNYTKFNPNYNLREILDDEIVIEFDCNDKDLCWKGINFTAINLHQSGYKFEIYDHGGKSPHLHLHNLPIKHLTKEERHAFKKLFIKKYVPEEYFKWADMSLTGVHLIAIEFCFHWKGCYETKELLTTF